MRYLVTGGAGFIGSALVRALMADAGNDVLVLDNLTYAGGLETLSSVQNSPRFRFMKADIRDPLAVSAAFEEFRPDVVTHLAAESHVDRSIDDPASFVQTNIVGTFTLLDRAVTYWSRLSSARQEAFRFHQVSTDEVFGSLGETGLFTEASPYDPRSPYSASKAAADHLVRAWGHTYDLPVIVTNCSNNFGPFQFPEKLMPLMIIRAVRGQSLPVYGDGANVRDWLFVEDHAKALQRVLDHGTVGETYNIGGETERSNLDVVRSACAVLDRLSPRSDGAPYADQITFVADRPGHDRRYAIDASKMRDTLGWKPSVSFEEGLERTVRWYLENRAWWEPLVARAGAVERRGVAS